MVNKIVICTLSLFIVSCVGTFSEDKDVGNIAKLNHAKDLILKGKYTRAKNELEFIIFTDPNSKYAYDAQYYLAESKFYLEQYKEALNEFESYLSLPIRDKDLSAKAEFMICKCWYHSTNEILKDQSNTDIALEKLQYYIEKESMIYYVDEISRMIFSLRKKLAEKDYQTALLYLKLDNPEAAIVYFQNIISEYYDTNFIDDSITNIVVIKNETDKYEALKYLESFKDYFSSEKKYIEAFNKISKNNQ